MGVWSVTNFAGGMNDYLHPSLLEKNTAQLLVDGNIDNGKIKPVRRSFVVATDTTPEERFFQYNTLGRSAVEWNGITYWSYNGNNSKPFYGTNDSSWGGSNVSWNANLGDAIGVPYPVYEDDGEHVVPSFDDTLTSPLYGLIGKYKYCVTFVNYHGWESAPGSPTSECKSLSLGSPAYQTTVTHTVENEDGSTTTTTDASEVAAVYGRVRISLNRADLPANVHYAKVYRTIDNGADFYFVGFLADFDDEFLGIENNSMTFVDSLSDSLLVMRNPLTTYDYDAPPDGGKYLCQSNGVFYVAVGSKLYFSVQDNPNAWKVTSFVGFDDDITGIVPEFSGVLVFTSSHSWQVTGAYSAETVTRTLIPGNQGCINYKSIGSISNAPIWLSQDGLCAWDGQNVSLVSYRRLKISIPAQVISAATANDKYFLFLSSGVVVYDKKNGGIFYKYSLRVNYAWYDESSDTIFFQQGRTIYEFNRGNSSIDWTYVSPYIGGTDLINRRYDAVTLSCSANSRLTVYVEDKVLLSVTLPSGRQKIKLPLNATGRYMHVKLVSAGELSELAVFYSGGD